MFTAICRRFTFAFVLVATLSAWASPQESNERREFLYNLGFEDVSSVIRERLKKFQYTTELNRRQMEANVVSYETLNASRELSILMLEHFNLDNLSNDKAREIALFAAKMLNVKPYAPATDYPTEITQIKDKRERQRELNDWLSEKRTRQMNEQKLRILSDITELLFGKDIAANKETIHRVDNLLTTIVDRMYMDNEIGNSKYFGRALTVLLVREEKLRGEGKTPLTRVIAAELRGRYNLYLENFIGDTMVFPTKNGKEVQYKIENGTMMLSRNLSRGSLQISWAAVPKSEKRRWSSRFQGLIGTPLANGLYVTPEDTQNGITTPMRWRDEASQEGILREGFSHIVYYQIKEDPKTGIKMPRVIHNYPDRTFDETDYYVRTGGVAMVYPEQVIDLSHHSAVYFSSPDPVKTKQWFDKNWQKNGYRDHYYELSTLKFDKSGLKPLKTKATESWTTQISKKDFDAIHAQTDPVKASAEIWKRFADGLENGVINGTGFHWPDPYDFALQDMTYCSLYGVKNSFETLNIDLEEDGSSWSAVLHGLNLVGDLRDRVAKTFKLGALDEMVKKTQKITKIPIVAPTSLVTQRYMIGKKLLFYPKTIEQRSASTYLTDQYQEINDRETEEIVRQMGELNRFDARAQDPFDKSGATIRDLRYGMVSRASRGVKTSGIDIETLADMTAEEALPAIKQAGEIAAAKKAELQKSEPATACRALKDL